MPKQKVNLRKVFEPSDSIAFLVIAVGLFIALFLDEMSVRLIGICITVLGGVALFMTVSPRLTQLQIISPVRPSQTTLITSQTVEGATGRSQTFDPDAYRASFGEQETDESSFVDDSQIGLFGDPPQKLAPQARVTLPVIGTELSTDTDSSVRIVGALPTRRVSKPPTLVSEARRDRNQALAQQQQSEMHYGSIDGPVTTEIHLSDDVVVRPIGGVPTPAVTITVEEPEDVANEFVADEEAFEEIHIEIVDVEPEVIEEAPRSTTRHSPAVALSTFVNDSDEEEFGAQEPRREFDYLLNRVLMVIRSATNARTAAFLWVNSERQQLVVEAKITEAEQEFTDERKIPMGHDALSQIARDGRPEIITLISPGAELDLLPYYSKPAGTISFIGVPVYYGGNVVGILCADSQIEDAYSDLTVGFFGQFTKLISGLVSSYTAKFDLMQAASTLEAQRKFREQIPGSPTSMQQVVRALFGTLIQLMDISRIAAVCFDNEVGAWVVVDARTALEEDYRSLSGSLVDLSTSAVGVAINTGETVILTGEDEGVRVVANEPLIFGGQFVGIPIRTATDSYGALVLENVESSLSQQDISIAESLGEQAGAMIELVRSAERLNDTALLDAASGLLNRRGFERRIREEFSRSVEHNLPLTLCLIKLDPSRSPAEHREHALLGIARVVQKQIRDYDVLARFGPDEIALGLSGYKLQDAQNWTESMRREIASSPVDLAGKRVSFTVSIGIAQAETKLAWDDVLAHAMAALEVSTKAGNRVTPYA